MGKLIQLLIGLVWPGGADVAHGVTNAFSLVALLPVALWLKENADTHAVSVACGVSLSYGQLALVGLAAFVALKIAQYRRPPAPPWMRAEQP